MLQAYASLIRKTRGSSGHLTNFLVVYRLLADTHMNELPEQAREYHFFIYTGAHYALSLLL